MNLEQELLNTLSHSGAIALLANVFFFLLGTFVKWKKHIGSINADIVTQLTNDNKAYQTLVESKNKEIETLKQQLESMVPQLKYCESMLQNRNPVLDQFIYDARKVLNIPEGVQPPSSQ